MNGTALIFSLNSRHLLRVSPRLFSSRKTWDPDSEQYQWLERSTLPTYHFQKSLRRLPIPKLEKTCERYLRAIRPLLSEKKFENTQKIVNNFQNNEGAELQKALLEYDNNNKHTSYISKTWFDIYLTSRKPVPINYNPFLALTPDPAEGCNDMLVRATNMTLSIGRFKKSLDAEVLTPEIFHLNPKRSKTPFFTKFCKALPESISWYGAALFQAFALDMSQHPSLFNTTRIPRKDKDEIYRNPGQRHFIVMRNGHFFTVDLFHSNGALVSPQELYTSLHHIAHLPLTPPSHPIGIFSCLERNEWAALREKLVSLSGNNADSLGLLDSSIFVLSLEEKPNQPFQRENVEPYVRKFLHGDGANRWFDKSFSLIVDDNLAAINFEHSWGDGVAVLRMVEDVQKDSCTNHFVGPDEKPSSSLDVSKLVKKLDFDLDDSLKQSITTKLTEYKKWCDSLKFTTVEYEKMNRGFLKKAKISPDAIMQLTIQMAYYRMTGKTTATYESCSTSAFRHGRTETMRPATSATKRCVQAFLSAEKPSTEELRKLLDECSKVHSQLVKEASLGEGFDRHLLGLDVTAGRLNEPRPQIFEDKVWEEVNQYILSTSTLSTETVALGGFGPVIPNGFGIGYNIAKQRLGYVISAYPEHTDLDKFRECIVVSLDDIHQVLQATSPS